MADAVTQSQFYDAMRQLDERLQSYHRSQREHIDNSCESILRAFQAHEKEDRAVADRVLTIETERDIEKKQATRLGAIAGSVAAGLIIALVEAFKRLLTSHP